MVAVFLVGCSDSQKSSQLENGHKTLSDQTNAVSVLLLAAQNGNAEAQNAVGNRYYKGAGRPKDHGQALHWYRKAAEQGHPLAQYNLGWMIWNGEGVAQDFTEALRWYRKSADQGYSEAQHKVGFAYATGQGVVKDYAEALKWYRKGAEQGNAGSQYNIADCYGNGHGVPQNYREAFRWYLMAAQQGIAVAQLSVGDFYRAGTVVDKDAVEAYKWYRLAATQRDDDVWNKQAAEDWKRRAATRCDQLSREITPEQLKDGQRRASDFRAIVPAPLPPTEFTEIITLRDESKAFEVRVHRILIGQRIVDEGLFHQFQLDELRKRKKQVVYFEVSVENIGGPQEHNLTHFDFTLEDSKGNSYSGEQTRDYLTGKIHWGKTGRGGVAFAVYEESTPWKLLYNTGFVNSYTREKLFASVDSLNRLKIFQRPVGDK